MEEENKVEDKKRIFGFRSQKIWKKIIAVVYYLIGLLMVFAVLTDWTVDISLKDTILVKVSDFFTLLIYFSPFLVLSDFSKDIRSKVPLLKDNKKGKTFLFFVILIIVIPIISNSITDTFHSEEYKEKVKIEQEEAEKAAQQAQQIKAEEEKKKAEENTKKEKEEAEKKAQEEKEKKEAEEKAKKEKEEADKKAQEEQKKAEQEAKINEEKAFKDSCKTYKYKEIARNPDKYKGKNVKFTGEVMQVSEGWFNSVTILLQVTKNEYGWYEDTVYCNYTYKDGEDKILEDDIITIYGTCEGDTSYISVLGSSITIPEVNIKYLKIK